MFMLIGAEGWAGIIAAGIAGTVGVCAGAWKALQLSVSSAVGQRFTEFIVELDKRIDKMEDKFQARKECALVNENFTSRLDIHQAKLDDHENRLRAIEKPDLYAKEVV